jgi:hypothetical protein
VNFPFLSEAVALIILLSEVFRNYTFANSILDFEIPSIRVPDISAFVFAKTSTEQKSKAIKKHIL